MIRKNTPWKLYVASVGLALGLTGCPDNPGTLTGNLNYALTPPKPAGADTTGVAPEQAPEPAPQAEAPVATAEGTPAQNESADQNGRTGGLAQVGNTLDNLANLVDKNLPQNPADGTPGEDVPKVTPSYVNEQVNLVSYLGAKGINAETFNYAKLLGTELPGLRKEVTAAGTTFTDRWFDRDGNGTPDVRVRTSGTTIRFVSLVAARPVYDQLVAIIKGADLVRGDPANPRQRTLRYEQ